MSEGTTEDELARAVRSLPSLKARFELRSGYLTEKSSAGEHELAVVREQLNRSSALDNLRWAVRFVPTLHSVPFDIVAASGSTSYRSASASKDLDFFCVAPAGRLWRSLAQALIHARIFSLLHPSSPQICFSCVMDEDFATSMFGTDRGPLFARDALETIVIRGRPSYSALLRKAAWVDDLYPQAYSEKIGETPDERAIESSPSAQSRVFDALLYYTIGAYVRFKARMLSRKMAKSGRADSVFNARIARDHLIYESLRYSNLKQKYAESFANRRPQGPVGRR